MVKAERATPRFGFPIRTFNSDDGDYDRELDYENIEEYKASLTELVAEHGDTIAAALTELASSYGMQSKVVEDEAEFEFPYDLKYKWTLANIAEDVYGLLDIFVYFDIHIVGEVDYGYVLRVQTTPFGDDLPSPNADIDGMLLSMALVEHTGLDVCFTPSSEYADSICFGYEDKADLEDLVCSTD